MEEISYSGEKPKKTKRLSKRKILFIIFLVAIVGLTGGLIFFVSGKNPKSSSKEIKLEKAVKTVTPTMTPTPSPKQSPTPTISVKKSNLKISIQNGSGEVGVAGTASTLLKTSGYSVVSTGNADSFDYKGITIRIKKSKNSYITDLIKDLSLKYNLSASDVTSDLSEGESFDALVIVGK